MLIAKFRRLASKARAKSEVEALLAGVLRWRSWKMRPGYSSAPEDR